MAKKYTMHRLNEGVSEEFVSDHIEQYGEQLFFKMEDGETLTFFQNKELGTWKFFEAKNPENEYYLSVELDTRYFEVAQEEWEKMKERSKK